MNYEKDYNWNRLLHAYGFATNTPEQLKNFFAVDEKLIIKANDHLYSAVIHQETIYSVTPVVVKIFIEALSDPKHVLYTHDRLFDVLYFLEYAGISLSWQIELMGEDYELMPPPTPEKVNAHFDCDEDDIKWGSLVCAWLMEKAVYDMLLMAAHVIKTIHPFTTSENSEIQKIATKAIAQWTKAIETAPPVLGQALNGNID